MSILDEILSSAPDRHIRDYLRLFMKDLPHPVIFPLAQKDIEDLYLLTGQRESGCAHQRLNGRKGR